MRNYVCFLKEQGFEVHYVEPAHLNNREALFLFLTKQKINRIYLTKFADEWFMGFFVDAYDWVMMSNVYAMSQYADKGSIITKPYISDSNYILK